MKRPWKFEDGEISFIGRYNTVSVTPVDKDGDVCITATYKTGHEEDTIYIPFDILAAYVDYHRNKINGT